MFEYYRRIWIAGSFLFFSLPGVQADSTATNIAIEARDQDIQQLLKITGVDDFLVQMPELVEAGLFMWVQSNQTVRKDKIEKIKRLISEFFNHTYFQNKLQHFFKVEYDGLRIKKVIRLFSSPLSQQMLVLENELRSEKGKLALQRYPDQLDKHPPTPLRTELVAKLNLASHSSEMILRTQLHVLKNILLVASSMSDDGTSLSLNQINAILDTANLQIRQQVVELVIVSFLFTYREASDVDLQNYVEFYNNENLQWFFSLYLKALEATFIDIPSELKLFMASHP